MQILRKLLNLKKALAVLGWAILASAGVIYLDRYESLPGATIDSPAFMSASELHKNAKNLPTLLVFAHPQCPCTWATIHELEQLVAHAHGLIEVRMLFLQPANEPRDWVESALWQQAVKIPGVIVSDINEKQLERFGEVTSGQTMLYDPSGNLIFSGGITDGRGHEGDNPGRSSIENYLLTNSISVHQTPVYGCALMASEKKL